MDKYNVLFYDDDIIVCDKSAGLLSQPDEKGSENLLDMLSERFPQKKIGLVHRLDRGVGGVMVFSANERSIIDLNRQIQDGLFEKTYLAVVHGQTPGNGEMTDFLFKDKTKNKSYVVKTQRKGAKQAILNYKTLACLEGYSLVKIALKTGRFHQIRCQLSSRKFPIVGDGKYGSKENGPIALYCKSLTFTHPKTKEKVTFVAENRTFYPFDKFDYGKD